MLAYGAHPVLCLNSPTFIIFVFWVFLVLAVLALLDHRPSHYHGLGSASSPPKFEEEEEKFHQFTTLQELHSIIRSSFVSKEILSEIVTIRRNKRRSTRSNSCRNRQESKGRSKTIGGILQLVSGVHEAMMSSTQSFDNREKR